jgi:hypothetical protein
MKLKMANGDNRNRNENNGESEEIIIKIMNAKRNGGAQRRKEMKENGMKASAAA